jgi:hypothetical protein
MGRDGGRVRRLNMRACGSTLSKIRVLYAVLLDIHLQSFDFSLVSACKAMSYENIELTYTT